jgi:hypothetical protein
MRLKPDTLIPIPLIILRACKSKNFALAILGIGKLVSVPCNFHSSQPHLADIFRKRLHIVIMIRCAKNRLPQMPQK